MSIDSSKFVKDVAKVKKVLRKNEDGSVTALSSISMLVPYRYTSKNLLIIKDTVKVLGCYALVLDDKYYAMDNNTCLFDTEPTTINNIIVDDEAYVELVFDKGDKVISNPQQLADKDLVYVVGQEVLNNGKVPWFFSYDDIVTLNLNFEKYNGFRLFTDMAIYELFVSLMQRDPKNIELPYRVGVKAPTDFATNPPVIVGINKVDIVVSGTMARLGGPYLSASITGGLNAESTNLSNMEYLLRA